MRSTSQVRQLDRGISQLIEISTFAPGVGEADSLYIVWKGKSLSGEETDRIWGVVGILTLGYGQKVRMVDRLGNELVSTGSKVVNKVDNILNPSESNNTRLPSNPENLASRPVTKPNTSATNGSVVEVPKVEHTGGITDSVSPANPGSQVGSGVTKPIVDYGAGKGLTSTQIKDVKSISATDANKSFIEKGWNAPYDPSTQVRQFTTVTEIKGEFVRVYAEGVNKPTGSFLVRADEIKGMTPQQIQQHLALPTIPTHIADVTIPTGTKMQTGKVAPQPDFGAPNKGGTQYELLDRIPETSFKNMRPLK